MINNDKNVSNVDEGNDNRRLYHHDYDEAKKCIRPARKSNIFNTSDNKDENINYHHYQ